MKILQIYLNALCTNKSIIKIDEKEQYAANLKQNKRNGNYVRLFP